MPNKRKLGRAKISTTISAETYRYLSQKVSSGEVSNLAEALDRCIHRVRQLENRERLARATANYFDHLDPKAATEESEIARHLASSTNGIDFDKEL